MIGWPVPGAHQHQPRGRRGDVDLLGRRQRQGDEARAVHAARPIGIGRLDVVRAHRVGRQRHPQLVAHQPRRLQSAQQSTGGTPHQCLADIGIDDQRSLAEMRTAQERLGHVAVLGDERVGVTALDRRDEAGAVEPDVHQASAPRDRASQQPAAGGWRVWPRGSTECRRARSPPRWCRLPGIGRSPTRRSSPRPASSSAATSRRLHRARAPDPSTAGTRPWSLGRHRLSSPVQRYREDRQQDGVGRGGGRRGRDRAEAEPDQ